MVTDRSAAAEVQPARWRGRWVLLALAGLVVAVGASLLTAHGLIEVAVGSGVPVWLGWLYPVITDGLALVASAATTQLAGNGRRYAWTVVIVAAGLSGLAQAFYLADRATRTHAGGVAQAAAPSLRFVIGAWPAVAALVAAHLLYLIGRSAPSGHGSGPLGGNTAASVPASSETGQASEPRGVPAEINGHSLVMPQIQPELQRELPVGEPSLPDPPDAATDSASAGDAQPKAIVVPRGAPMPMALDPIDRARTAAELHRRRAGRWPSVRELRDQAEVGQGTAHRALKELREQTVSQPRSRAGHPEGLHVAQPRGDGAADPRSTP